MLPSAHVLLFSGLIALAVIVQLQLIGMAFEKLGLSENSAYLLLIMALIGSMINVPLFRLAARTPGGGHIRRLRAAFPVACAGSEGHTLVAMNIGGAVVPVAFSLYLLLSNPITPLEMIGVVTFVASVSFLSSAPTRGRGLGMPVFLAPVAAVLMSLCLNREYAASLAYVGASIGVLLGADLLRLGPVRQSGTAVASIGSAGSFDAVFLAGLFAVVLC